MLLAEQLLTKPELSLSRFAAHKYLGFSDHLFDLANQPRHGDLPACIVDRGGLEPEQRAHVLRQIGRLRECRSLYEQRENGFLLFDQSADLTAHHIVVAE